MWSNKSTVIVLCIAACLVLLLAACDGASVSDSIPALTNVALQAETAGSPIMIGSYPHKDKGRTPSNDDAFHYLVLFHNIRVDLIVDAGVLRFITVITDRLITVGGAILLIALGICVFSRLGTMAKNQHK